jgi:hypothetical protein
VVCDWQIGLVSGTNPDKSKLESNERVISSNKILTRLLDDCLGNAGALPLIHALLYLLLKESCPSSESLASFISEFKDNDRIGVFQEAVIDVVTAVVEQDNLRKEELARLEGGDAAIDKQNAQCPRPLAVLRSLMVSPAEEQLKLSS